MVELWLYIQKVLAKRCHQRLQRKGLFVFSMIGWTGPDPAVSTNRFADGRVMVNMKKLHCMNQLTYCLSLLASIPL